MGIDIGQALTRYPRETFTRQPTPLQVLEHVSVQLGVRLYLKRDDLTDLALGGDKSRKLEYEVAKARAQGATVLVTCGSAQSNHARLTAAAARRVGLGVTVVLSDDSRHTCQGNLLTVYLMGADVRSVESSDHWELEEHAKVVCEELRASGEKPYYIPVSGSTPLSCLGYVRAGLELADQMTGAGFSPAAVYLPFGTGGIVAGVLAALRARDFDCPVVGISVNVEADRCRENLETWWRALGDLLEWEVPLPRGLVEIYDQFIGRGYGDATDDGLEAIGLMARAEGILLDPVYSGKVFAAVCAHQQNRRWSPEEPVVMLHTGGAPALFAYATEIRQYLEKQGIRFPDGGPAHDHAVSGT